MTNTLTDAQSLTIANALTHTLTASDRRQRRIGDAIFFRNPIRTERSGGRMGSQPTHTLSASEMRYSPTNLTALRTSSSTLAAASRPRERSRLQLTPDSVGGTRIAADAPRTRRR